MQTNHKKYFKSLFLLSLLGVFAISAFLTSCNKDEDKGTNELTLLSYGPMPIARGAELTFVGKNLDKVNSIVLPENIAITSADFTEHTAGGIKLIVPQNAVEGYVQLMAGDMSITTKTPMGFLETISLSGSFSPKTIKPGAVLTIEGDYLNLVNEVIFTDRVVADTSAFVSQSRYKLEVTVPAAAQTGKISVSTGGAEPIIIYSADELTVTIPTITKLAPSPVVPGTELTITGTDMDLVTSVTLGGGAMVSELTKTTTTAKLTVPMDAQDGKVVLNLASGVMVTSSADLVMVVPTVSVAPTTIKTGATLTVTGQNLNLISEVVFGGEAIGVIQDGGTATQIKVTVPDGALTGDVMFNTTSAKSVSGGSLTLVSPAITSFTPASAKPGTDLVITGTNLDLVAKVLYTGGVEGTISAQSATEITVSIPVGSGTGAVTLVAINGIEVATATNLEVLQNLPEFTAYGEAKGSPGSILTITGTKLNLVKELIFPGDLVATAYGEKTDTKIEVYVPKNIAIGKGQISLITYEGDEGLLPELYFGGADPVLNEDYVFFDFNNTGNKDSWWGNAIGSAILDDAPNSVDGTSFWNIDGMSGTGWWDGLFFRNGSNNFVTDGLDVATDVFKFDVNVREAIAEGGMKIRLGNASDDGGDGYWYTWAPWNSGEAFSTVGWISIEIPLSEFKDGSGNSIPDLTKGGTEFGFIWSYGTSIKINMGIDNIRFQKK